MTLHREGNSTIGWSVLSFLVVNLLAWKFLYMNFPWAFWLILVSTLVVLIVIISFFRVPERQFTPDEHAVLAPCDGKVVVIEEVQPDEYFTDKRIQVSIFMSPLNVHINFNPVSGSIIYNQYQSGKYLVAWHPKSSTENERHTNVYKTQDGRELLTKQIAGALAKRIVNYNEVGKTVSQSGEMGFIKFGSRVDLLLPLDAAIKVKIGDHTVGGKTVIAEW